MGGIKKRTSSKDGLKKQDVGRGKAVEASICLSVREKGWDGRELLI